MSTALERFDERQRVRVGTHGRTIVHDGEKFRLYTTHPDVRVRFSTAPGDSK